MQSDKHYKLVTGDLLEAPDTEVICHQCNCTSTGAGGIARVIFDRFPWADVYSEREQVSLYQVPGFVELRGNNINSKRFLLGRFAKRRVLAMYAQYHGGGPSDSSEKDTSQNRVTYFAACLMQMRFMASKPFHKAKGLKSPITKFSFPHSIGCGIGGGDWEKDYEPMINDFARWVNEHTDDGQVTIYQLPQ